jgi:AraC-like DNA-binding protein
MKDFLRRRKVMLAGIGGAVLMLLLVAIALIAGPMGAFAASSPAATKTPTNSAQTKKVNPYCTLYQQSLATKLNVSVTTLTQDRKDALDAVIAQKVKDGKLKQAQATKLEQMIAKSQGNNCNLTGTAVKLNAARQFVKKYRPAVAAEIAQKLGITVTDLTSQLKAGKSLHDIASARHVSDSTLTGYITTAINDTLQKAVQAGSIKQARVTAIDTFLKNHPKYIQTLISHHAKQSTTKAASNS